MREEGRGGKREREGKISITGALVWKFGTPTNRLFCLKNEGFFLVEHFSVWWLGGERQTFLSSQRNFSRRQVA